MSRAQVKGEEKMDLKQYKNRDEVPLDLRWQLEDIFADDAAWEEEYVSAAQRMESVATHKGQLSQSAGQLLAALTEIEDLDMDLVELFAYARMRRDEDNSKSKYQDMTDRITGLYYQSAAATAFLSPEIAAIAEGTLRSWLKEEPGLAPYRQQLENLMRTRPHILPEAQEALLSRFGPVADGINQTYNMLENVDIKLGSIEDEAGKTIELTPAVFGRLREHRQRPVRARAFARIHQAFSEHGNTLATLYATRIKADILYATARKHEDSLSQALFGDNLPNSLYSGLIEAVHEGQPTLNSYLDLRREREGLDQLHIYDTYEPIMDVPERSYTIDQACDIIRRGLRSL